ncbi:MAG: PLP-dependent aminotransferase family protein [Roseibium sp.]
MKVPKFPEGILGLDRTSSVPLSQQVYRAIRDTVRLGVLKPGIQLPSSRKLARDQNISRNTVNTAYELLRAEGIVEIRLGAAPVIADFVSPITASIRKSDGQQVRGLSKRGQLLAANLRGPNWAYRHGAFQPGAPALDAFPYELWARSLRRAARMVQSPDLLYQNSCGHPELKEVLADYLASERGVRTEPHQILVTSSMQAGLSALAATLADPADTAWIEDPGYLGARTAFHGAGLTIRGMPVDGEGAIADDLLAAGSLPKLIYVTPSHHYPFGRRMSLSRRLSLIETAAEVGATILEDDYDSEFLFEGRPIAALQGLAARGEVIYLGTFSKSLLPGLRVSYLVVPEELVASLANVLRNTGRFANVHAQIALADFITSGHYRAHLKHIRNLYQERGNALVTALKAELGNAVEVEYPTGNVQISLCFNEDRDDHVIAAAMQERGFSVSPLSVCFLSEKPRSGLIIGFAQATEVQIASGVQVLKEILKAQALPTVS